MIGFVFMENPKKILLTGGTGLIGNALTNALVQKGYIVHVLSRKKRTNEKGKFFFQWDIKQGIAEADAFKGIDTFIHLAGESIAEGKWTDKKKKRIISSRVDSAHLAFEYFKKNGDFPKKIISASGVGYYGALTNDSIFEETDKPQNNDFASRVCELWEEGINPFINHSTVSWFRIGVVLSEKGGALPVITKPIKMFVGAPLGSGQQYMPWIHIDDLINLFVFGVENNLEGVYNAVTDEHITNQSLTKAIAKQIKRPVLPINVPKFILQLMLGEQAEIILKGSRVSNEKVKGAGFKFMYKQLDKALSDLL